MRVAFVTTISAQWGGSEELWAQAAARLRAGHHQVAAFIWRWPELNEKMVALQESGVELFLRSVKPPAQWEKIVAKIVGARSDLLSLQRWAPDLVVISQGGCTDGIDWMLFCQRRGLKYVAISHANSESWEFDAPTCARMATAYGGAQKVYCVCEHNLRVLRSQTGSALPHGEIVKNPFNVSVDEPPAWPAENPWKMAGVARLDVTAKGQDLLFRVLAREEWQDRDYELNLYGTGPSEHDLREMARNLLPDRVRFHGHVEDIRRVWADNHMLVLPSRFEGLPLSLVEAMWCGRPAIVSNVGGNAELCLDGVTGFVAASASEAMLSEAMERAWHRRREWQSIGVAGRKRAEEIIPADPIAVFCRNLLQLG